MLSIAQDYQEKDLIAHRAVNLITFYFYRHYRRHHNNLKFGSVYRLPKLQRRILLFQIQYYPLLKRLLGHLLSYVVRQRYGCLRKAILLIQDRWKCHLVKKIVMASSIMSIDETFNNCSRSVSSSSPLPLNEENSNFMVCPSPAIILRGRPLLAPPERSLVSPLPTRLPLRTAPSILTPMRTTQTTNLLLYEQVAHNTRSPIKQPETSSSSTMTLAAKRKGPQRVVISKPPPFPGTRSASSLTTTNVFSSSTPSTPSIPTPTPPTPTTTSALLKPISNEAELALLTTQNTINNAGYQTCELIYEEVIREGPRPPSPSSHFCIHQSGTRKWTSPVKAREAIQQAWSDLLACMEGKQADDDDDHFGNQVNKITQLRRHIQWNPQICFIDTDRPRSEDQPTILDVDYKDDEEVNPFKVRSVIKSFDSTDGLSRSVPRKKSLIRVQRILYRPELPLPAPIKKALVKSRKK